MALSPFDRNVLNELIDSCVNDITAVVEFARIPELKSMLNDRDGSDFSLGATIAEIYTAFLVGFKMRNGRKISNEEKAEIFNILGKRIHEIKEAIFKCG